MQNFDSNHPYIVGPTSGYADTAGELAGSTNSTGVIHWFDYNALGEVVRDRFFWTNPTPSDGLPNQWVTTTTAYDSGGREISSTDSLGNATSTHYNALGQVDWTEDEYGNKTFNYYDVNGQLVESVSPTGTESITAYDSLNRARNAKRDNLEFTDSPEFTVVPFRGSGSQGCPVSGSIHQRFSAMRFQLPQRTAFRRHHCRQRNDVRLLHHELPGQRGVWNQIGIHHPR